MRSFLPDIPLVSPCPPANTTISLRHEAGRKATLLDGNGVKSREQELVRSTTSAMLGDNRGDVNLVLRILTRSRGDGGASMACLQRTCKRGANRLESADLGASLGAIKNHDAGVHASCALHWCLPILTDTTSE